MGDAVGRSEVHNFPRNAVLLKPLPYPNAGMCITCHAGNSTIERPKRQTITLCGKPNHKQKPPRIGHGAAELQLELGYQAKLPDKLNEDISAGRAR